MMYFIILNRRTLRSLVKYSMFIMMLGLGNFTHAHAQEVTAADVVFAIDSSVSTEEEVEIFLNSFIDKFFLPISLTGVDLRVVLIGSGALCLHLPGGSGMCPGDTNLPLYRHVITDVGSTNALAKIISTYDEWKDSLRSHSTKTLVVLSDDNSTMPAEDFNASLLALDPSFTGYKFHGFVDTMNGCNAVGSEYIVLGEITNGTLHDICNNPIVDIGLGLQEIAEIIIADLGNPPIPPSPTPLGGRDLITLRFKETPNHGVAVIVLGKIVDAEVNSTFSGQVTLNGKNIAATKICENISKTNPIFIKKIAGVEEFRCALSETKKEVLVKYKALNQALGEPYTATVIIHQDQKLALSGGGTIEQVRSPAN